MMKYIGLGLALVVALAVVGCGAKTGGTAKSNVLHHCFSYCVFVSLW